MIEFFFNEVEDFEVMEAEVSAWLISIANRYEKSIDYLEINFWNDEGLNKINKSILNHDDYTDIITIDLAGGEKTDKITGEIHISKERVEDNAKNNNVAFIDELHRVIAHGVLHLCGFDDKTDDLKAVMTNQEEIALQLRMF
jgi:rRNA maturation RNase YbeY